MPTALIIGGGFAGSEVARRLGGRFEVTVVADENFHLFTPMLAEVAAGDVEPSHIVSPLRQLCPKAHVVVGSVTSVDATQRSVVVQPQIGETPFTLSADYLVLAAGSVSRDFGIPGVAEHALEFKTISDAISIRRRVVSSLEAAAETGDASLTRIAVVGAGYSGAEVAASLADFVRSAVERYYPEAPEPSVTIIDAADRLVPTLPPKLSDAAGRQLSERGVDIILEDGVTSVTAEGLTLKSGRKIEAATVIWAAGVEANPLATQSGLQLHKGRIVVDKRFQAAPGVFALGDIAAVPTGNGDHHPPTAQHAMRQGTHLGKILPKIELGLKAKPFSYTTRGQLVSLGHHNAVGLVFGIPISGIAAWFLWRTYYWWRLPTVMRKLRVAIDWTLDSVFPPDVAALPPGS